MGACGGKESSGKEVKNRADAKRRDSTPTKKASRSCSIFSEIQNLPKLPERKACRYVSELQGPEADQSIALFNAVEDGIAATIQILKKSADPSVLNSQGDAPLHYAIVSPAFHTELGILLLEYLATPSVLASSPHTLELACAAGRVTAAQKLLDLNATVIGSEILAIASQSSDDDDDKECFESPAGINIMKRIISVCPNATSEQDEADTPLHLALVNGKPHLAALLLSHNVNTNITDANNRLPIHNVMCLPENIESVALVKKLVTSSTVNAADIEGDTPLHWAAYFDRPQAAEVLVAAGADVQAKNNSQESAFDVAKKKKSTGVHNYLTSLVDN